MCGSEISTGSDYLTFAPHDAVLHYLAYLLDRVGAVAFQPLIDYRHKPVHVKGHHIALLVLRNLKSLQYRSEYMLKYMVVGFIQQERLRIFEHGAKKAFVSGDAAQNIVVVHTVSGMAMAAAKVLDELNWSEIVGCIAGDDVIMCVARDDDSALLILEKLKKILDNFDSNEE